VSERRTRLAVLSDFPEEGWPSMDLAAEMLLRELSKSSNLSVVDERPRLPPGAHAKFAGRFTRAFARYGYYSARALAIRGQYDAFHLVDHSYAHLVLCLPRGRTGVYCHDTDAFRALFEPSPRSRRAIAAALLSGLRRADLVFYSTSAVRREIVQHGLVAEERLVHAPLGVPSEFNAHEATPRSLDLLHVGSLIPRKNPEFLLRLVAELRRQLPALEFLQVGGQFDTAQRRLITELGLGDAVRQVRGISRAELAEHYRSAGVVLLPSKAEGFGLPVIEALACGAPVVASDIDALREVGGEAVSYCAVDDLRAWTGEVLAVLRGAGPTRAARLGQAARYSWAKHADVIARAYVGLAGARREASA
jgi:glycosyltransferase involved in cell wall biosynthesis